jgi:hypothetical protein
MTFLKYMPEKQCFGCDAALTFLKGSQFCACACLDAEGALR